MIKNTASQTVSFQMISTTDGSDVTSGIPAVYVCGDGGSQGTGSGAITHEGHGCWSYAVSAADSNFSHVSFTMVLSGAVSQTVNVYPVTLADYKSDATAANQTTIIGHLTDIKGATFSGSTDSLEAIRDHGDDAWLTGGAGTAPTVEEIRAEIDTNSTQLAAVLTRLTEARAGYLDKLNVSGTLAHSDAAAIYKADVSDLSSILEDTGTTIPGLLAALNDISVSDIISGVSDGSYDLQEIIRIGFAVLCGHGSGGGTDTITYKDPTNSKSRIVTTVDADGNRTPTSYDGS